MVIGHRGSGMNKDLRLKAIKENSILSFNEAGRSCVDFVEFDVQVSYGVISLLTSSSFYVVDRRSIFKSGRYISGAQETVLLGYVYFCLAV